MNYSLDISDFKHVVSTVINIIIVIISLVYYKSITFGKSDALNKQAINKILGLDFSLC